MKKFNWRKSQEPLDLSRLFEKLTREAEQLAIKAAKLQIRRNKNEAREAEKLAIEAANLQIRRNKNETERKKLSDLIGIFSCSRDVKPEEVVP